MSETLTQVSQLSAIFQALPGKTNDWIGDLVDQIGNVVSGLVNSIVGDAKNTITSAINGVHNYITDQIKGVTDFLGDVYMGVYNWLFDANTGVVKKLSDQISGVVDKVVNGVQTALGGIGDQIRAAIQSIADKIQSIIDAIGNIGQQIGNVIGNALSGVGEWLKNAILSVLDATAAWIAGVVDQFGHWLAGIYYQVSDWLAGAIKTVGDWVKGAYDWIAQAIKDVGNWIATTYQNISQWINGTIQTVVAWLSDVLAGFLKWKDQVIANVTNWLQTRLIPDLLKIPGIYDKLTGQLDTIWGDLLADNPQKAFDDLDKLFGGLGIPAPSGMLQGILYAWMYLSETIKLKFIPMQIAATKHAIIDLALEPLDLTTAANGVFRGKLDNSGYSSNAALTGISHDKANLALEVARPLTPPDVVKEIYLRGEINESQHDSILTSYGFTSTAISEIKKAYPVIPSIMDLVHFADRFAWDDSIANRFMYDSEYPPEVEAWVQKIGLSPEWFKRYWRAHWELPGLQDIFEMYHRLRPGDVDKPFSEDDLDDYLKTTPLPPYFHELLKEITYLPLTRVDIRRMYKSGVLTQDQVYKAYLDNGYNDVNAKMLTDFTIHNYTPEDTSQKDDFEAQARTTYANAYKHRLISEDEYRVLLQGLQLDTEDINLLITLDNYAMQQSDKVFSLDEQKANLRKIALQAYGESIVSPQDVSDILANIGYTQDETNLELSAVDYAKQIGDRQTLVDLLHTQYIEFEIDDFDLHRILSVYNYNGFEIDDLISRWNTEKDYRTKHPAMSDLKLWLKQGLIDLDGFMQELRGLGYNEKYVALYGQSLAASKG